MEDKRFFYRGRVIDVYDGDSIKADIDLGFFLVIKRISIRLDGVDTAELTSKNPAVKQRAYAARDWLREACLDKDVYLDSFGQDKYGRWLCKVYTIDGKCLNDELVSSGLALEYDGGKKPDHASQVQALNS